MLFNRAAKAFLYGKNPEAFISEIETAYSQANNVKELEPWRKYGSIGKLHNIVTFIRRTSQRREAFQRIIIDDASLIELYKQLQMVADNATRWNFMYMMIDRALKLKDCIQYYFFQTKNGMTHGSRWKRARDDADPWLLKHDLSNDSDWAVLEDMHQILGNFHQVTMRAQGRGGDGERAVVWE